MHPYKASRLNPVAAISATGITIAVLAMTVVVPAGFPPAAREQPAVVAAQPEAPPREVDVFPGTIDVIGVRDPDVALSRQRDAVRTAQQRG